MTSRALVFVGLLVVSSCTPAPSCPKGMARTVPANVFTTANRSTVVSMTFPAPIGCALPDDTFLVTGAFTEADGTTRPLVVELQRHDQSNGSAAITISFMPSVPGIGELKVFVDPQLGIAQLPVFVARDGELLPSFEERSCQNGQASVTGHVACSTSSTVSLRFGGGEVKSFPAALGPQVVGNLLWLETTDGGDRVVERHLLLGDGGVELLDRSDPFRPGNAHVRYADEQRTFRSQYVAIPRDGGMGLVFQRTTPSNADAVVAEPERAWAWTTDRWCLTDGGCLPLDVRARAAGIEPGLWWEYLSPMLNLRSRPIADAGTVGSVELTNSLNVTIARRDVQRTFRPTWTENKVGHVVLERQDGGAFFFTRFTPPVVVTFQNDEFIGFAVDGGTRFVRLR